MGGFSIWHWLVVGIIILLLFGKGRFSEMMGDVAKGIKSFKKGMSEDEQATPPPPRQVVDGRTVEPPAPTARSLDADPSTSLGTGERREP